MDIILYILHDIVCYRAYEIEYIIPHQKIKNATLYIYKGCCI